jgi:hypothetical protein
MLARLKSIYAAALSACAPERLVRRIDASDLPRDVVAIGKCAGALLDGFAPRGRVFCVIPEGYRTPSIDCDEVWLGGHPDVDTALDLPGPPHHSHPIRLRRARGGHRRQ